MLSQIFTHTKSRTVNYSNSILDPLSSPLTSISLHLSRIGSFVDARVRWISMPPFELESSIRGASCNTSDKAFIWINTYMQLRMAWYIVAFHDFSLSQLRWSGAQKCRNFLAIWLHKVSYSNIVLLISKHYNTSYLSRLSAIPLLNHVL